MLSGLGLSVCAHAAGVADSEEVIKMVLGHIANAIV